MLTVNEIFYSIQGESTHAGRPCVFVRLTACDLRCSLVRHALRLPRGAQAIGRRGRRRGRAVRVSAGRDHRRRAAAAGRRVPADGPAARARPDRHARNRRPSPIDRVPARVVKIVDVKCPGSGEVGQERLGESRSSRAARRGEIRRQGPRRLRVRPRRHSDARPRLALRAPSCCRRCTASSTPRCCRNGCSPTGCPARLQLQLHKYIWDRPRLTRWRSERADSDMQTIAVRCAYCSERRSGFLHRRGDRQAEGFTLDALTVHYGQRHARELEAARARGRLARRRAAPRASIDLSRHRRVVADVRCRRAAAIAT